MAAGSTIRFATGSAGSAGSESRSRVSPTLGNRVSEKLDNDDELCFVNTRFSCLATREPDHSFVPIWRPRFISQFTPDDRCHLNGLGLRNGKPQWATALGESDCGGGWQVYWRQSFPGLGNQAIGADGRPMKNWWPFLFY